MKELSAVITCPHCCHKELEEMPVDSCVYFYVCKNCTAVLKPVNGDCCVFCSYADKKCPPKLLPISCDSITQPLQEFRIT